RNEGTDPKWIYAPPEGAVLPDIENIEFGDFDYDQFKGDEDAELWLVRVPNNIKPKHLKDVRISAPPPSSLTVKVGRLERKTGSYDIWALSADGEAEGDEGAGVGGEELRALSALLPRPKKGGKLYLAPKPIARHLVFAASPPIPSAPESDPGAEPATAPAGAHVYKNPPRPSYPDAVLKHRFLPYGSRGSPGTDSAIASQAAPIDADIEMVSDEIEIRSKSAAHATANSHKKGESEDGGKKDK
ncbi:hypothetical protein HETIRDRAFT_246524, partial [Heterobasidion irregulare TC 32-1]